MSSGGEKGGSGGGGGGGAVKTPSDFLKSIRGRPVVVKLNSGVDYRVGMATGRCQVGQERPRIVPSSPAP